jgi:hypothetical protein
MTTIVRLLLVLFYQFPVCSNSYPFRHNLPLAIIFQVFSLTGPQEHRAGQGVIGRAQMLSHESK